MEESIKTEGEGINIKLSKTTLWQGISGILLILLVVSIFTGGFGRGTTGDVVAGGDNTAGDTTGAAGDMSIFLNKPDLFPSIGPEDAKNVVIEFSDFQCPYCALASGLPTWTTGYQAQYGDLIGVSGKIKDLAKKGDVRFIYVSMSFLGQESVYAAEAALCANEQGKFFEMHDAIFKASKGPEENDGRYSKDNLIKIAAGVSGLDQAKFKTCLESDKYLSDVKEIGATASAAGVSGTPTFYVNGKQASASWTQISGLIGA